ncbi:ATP-dependent RNA helicase DBP3 [Magnolia sinica]|uniref:ATP-dependent RNA helicase DBP3 n=1 Tax=Magnolia sinica TaxID=86752 RepID=UPI002657EC2E|nr:ATP-dependent RNA helicase DBP3 [Magnolia sinica]
MAKGDDAVRRRKNKVERKRLRKDSSSSSAVSSRVAAIIASKRRRKSGKRRICEGMCFSLPTPEDPFNERNEKRDFNKKKPKKLAREQFDVALRGNGPQKAILGEDLEEADQQDLKKLEVENWEDKQSKLLSCFSKKYQTTTAKAGEPKVPQLGEFGVAHAQRRLRGSITDCHSKFLILCLNAIEKAWMHDGTFDGDVDRPLMDNAWGAEFWEHCSVGSDILETTRACSSREQTAWLVSAASDIITRKEKEGLLVDSPFLLLLVPSQEKAIKVRSVCKPLKALGIHTVSLHPGASVDHQVLGLKSCEPEFLVSTPERLLELVSLRAIDISRISLLVLDGLESLINGGFMEMIKSIRQYVSGDPQTVIFSDVYGSLSTSVARNLLRGPICRLSLSDSVSSQSVGISQSIYMCTSEEEKMSKAIEVLNEVCDDRVQSSLLRVLFITGTADKAQTFATSFKAEGFNILYDPSCDGPQEEHFANHDSKKRLSVSVMDKEQIGGCTDVGDFEIVVFVDFPSSIDDYVEVLTAMARCSVDGALHSFFCPADMQSAGPLVQVLEQCAQPVPDILRNYI